ncbi:tRNA-binding protein Pbp11 [Thermococcus sp. 21S7]|uniref:tRNA-binding protein Pbp11 n=1 Tax=Thermococcus sp. 21S7 TaxID=1638221 RepID=UPI0014395D80|nr:tRNA-binding protein Pbp11 [Thermococcus sp. 21S7]NJE61613.1 translation factor [Thermococcus sp. 21S7]
MGILEKLFGRAPKEVGGGEFIASRKPVARFRVEQTLNILGKETLIGTVEGIIYPGYKVRGRDIAPIREIQRERKRVDFAVDGDRVALILEGRANAKNGEVLEVYRS